MHMTSERLRCLLVISNAGGSMDHDDPRLAPFCDDKSTLSSPDIFNQCHDAEWLISRHDDRTDTSRVELTKTGRVALGLD